MTKYSSEFKVKLVREWATDGLSSYQLAKKYHLSHHYIQYWIEQARLQGITSLQHRRVKALLDQDGIHLADATVTRIMRQLGVQVSMYNQHRNGKYSSYRGTVGKIAQNVLQQSFTATKPYQVIHIDITQI